MFSLPRTDNGLLTWATTLLAGITPTPTTFGLTSATVTAYQGYRDSFADALAACDPAIRTRSATSVKNAARDELATQSKFIVNTVNGVPTVSDAQKIELGIPVRSAPTPIPAPAWVPIVGVLATTGRTVSLTIKSTSPTRRGRPPGVQGIAVFSHVGPTVPVSTNDWHFEANTTKDRFDVTLPEDTPAGATVWFTAFYFNPRLESGAPAVPVSTNLPGGGALPMAMAA